MVVDDLLVSIVRHIVVQSFSLVDFITFPVKEEIMFFSELRENLARMGTDIKQKIIDSVKSTWQTLNKFAYSHTNNEEMTTEQVDDILMSQMSKEQDQEDTCCKHSKLF